VSKVWNRRERAELIGAYNVMLDAMADMPDDAEFEVAPYWNALLKRWDQNDDDYPLAHDMTVRVSIFREELHKALAELGQVPVEPPTVVDGERRHGG
jgi:hypothetical protein